MDSGRHYVAGIRRAISADAKAICELHRAAVLRLEGDTYSKEQVEVWAGALAPERYLVGMRDFEFFVAEEGRVLGFLILNLEGAELNAVYVHPDAAGRGIGRRLCETAESLARERGLTELKVKSTVNAVGFYEALRFCRVRDMVHRSPAGIDLPCVQMKKCLEGC